MHLKEQKIQTAKKYDNQKPMMSLLPTKALTEVSKVLTFGAEKYGSHNWRNGMSWSRLVSASLRHIFAWLGGENKDPESGINHLAHATTNLLFLLEYIFTDTGEDDRWTS